MHTPEQRAREKIDELLTAAGWRVQSREQLNLGAACGVAVREFPLTTGFADYLLFVDRKPIYRPDGHPLQADAGLFQPEPGHGVLPRAGRGRRRQLDEARSAEDYKAVNRLETALDDLTVLDERLGRVIEAGYDPEIDDGVKANILPLQEAEVLRYKKVV